MATRTIRDPIPVPAGAKYMTVAQLRARWGGVSHMTVERKIKNDPDFPKPVRLGHNRSFEITAIEEYERLRARLSA